MGYKLRAQLLAQCRSVFSSLKASSTCDCEGYPSDMRRVVCLFLILLSLGETCGFILLPLGCFQVNYDDFNKHTYTESWQGDFGIHHCPNVCRAGHPGIAGITRSRSDPDDVGCYCPEDVAILDDYIKLPNTQCHPCIDNRGYHRMCGVKQDASFYFYKEIDETIAVLWAFDVDILFTTNHEVGMINNTHKLYQPQAAFMNHSHVQVIDFHYKRAEAFALVWGDIYKINITDQPDLNAAPEPWVYLYEEMGYALAVDWVHDRVFWAQGFHGSIHMVDVDGSNQDVLVAVARHYDKQILIHDLAVDPYKGLLFWITDEPSLMSCHLDGTEIRRLLTDEQIAPLDELRRIKLDLAEERVYFIGGLNMTTHLYFTDYNGTSFQTVHIPLDEEQYINDFIVFKYEIYYVAASHNSSRNSTETDPIRSLWGYRASTVFKTSIKDNTAEAKWIIRAHEMVTHIRVYNSGLQSPGRTDQCTDFGCSHHCVILADNASCRCPSNYILDEDIKTCLMMPDRSLQDGWVFEVVISVSCIVFLLLAAGVLMCLCDKLWSHLHPTFSKLLLPPVVYRRGNEEAIISSCDHDA